MPEEMGLLLTLDAQLKSGAAERIKRDIEKSLAGVGVKVKSTTGTPAAAKDTTKDTTTNTMTKGIMSSLKGFAGKLPGGGSLSGGVDIISSMMEGLPTGAGGGGAGMKGMMGAGVAGGIAGAAVGMIQQGIEALKNVAMKIFDLMKQSSPLLQRSLKMIQIAVLSTIRPFADTLARILMPIARFFLLWGRAIYKDYREKYKKYVGEGMSPIEASIKASIESFVDGLVGLFTGTVGGIDLGTSVFEIINSVVKAFTSAMTDPEVLANILMIPPLIVGAVVLGLAGAAATFLEELSKIPFKIMGKIVEGLTGVTFDFTKLPGMIWDMILGMSKEDLRKKYFPEPPSSPGMNAFWWEQIYKMLGLPPPVFAAAGGVFTKPTFGMIGEAGPEAVIPLSKMKNLGGGTVVTNNITISGPIYGVNDLENTISRTLDRYMMNFERGR